MENKEIMASIVFIGVAVLANLLINHFGKWATPFVAAAFIGLNITCRDYLHECWSENLWLKMLGLIGIGSVLTFLVNSSALWIAIASFLGFFFAGVVDTLVYGRLIDRNSLLKINGSNLFSSFTDSFIFISIAFGGFFPVVILIQFVAKFLGGLAWSPIVGRLID